MTRANGVPVSRSVGMGVEGVSCSPRQLSPHGVGGSPHFLNRERGHRDTPPDPVRESAELSGLFWMPSSPQHVAQTFNLLGGSGGFASSASFARVRRCRNDA